MIEHAATIDVAFGSIAAELRPPREVRSSLNFRHDVAAPRTTLMASHVGFPPDSDRTAGVAKGSRCDPDRTSALLARFTKCMLSLKKPPAAVCKVIQYSEGSHVPTYGFSCAAHWAIHCFARGCLAGTRKRNSRDRGSRRASYACLRYNQPCNGSRDDTRSQCLVGRCTAGGRYFGRMVAFCNAASFDRSSIGLTSAGTTGASA